MSKKDKTIEVTIETRKSNSDEVSVVMIGDREIGEVRPDGERFLAVVEHEQFRAKSVDEGIEMVLREYHLHN